MRDLFLTLWDAATRWQYKPDAYLKRVDSAIHSLTFLGSFDEKAFSKKDPPFDTPRDITDQVVMLRDFSKLTLELWEALGKAGLLSTMGRYSNRLSSLERHYAKTDCKECGSHAPAHVVGCKNMPESWR